jgi:hypothetical protein
MSDAPNRAEIDAKLDAANARTEARFASLQGDMDVRFVQMGGKIDSLSSDIRVLTSRVDETLKTMVSESKTTRGTMLVVGSTSILTVLGLIIMLWQATLSSQANMLAAFQSGISMIQLQPSGGPPTKQ